MNQFKEGTVTVIETQDLSPNLLLFSYGKLESKYCAVPAPTTATKTRFMGLNPGLSKSPITELYSQP